MLTDSALYTIYREPAIEGMIAQRCYESLTRATAMPRIASTGASGFSTTGREIRPEGYSGSCRIAVRGIDPPMFETTISRDEARRVYNRLGAGLDRAARFEGRARARALAALAPAPGQRVLHVGVGTGGEHGALQRGCWATRGGRRARPLPDDARTDAPTCRHAALRRRRDRPAIRGTIVRSPLLRLSARPPARRRSAARPGRVRARPPPGGAGRSSSR